jgi:hypothetical protein
VRWIKKYLTVQMEISARGIKKPFPFFKVLKFTENLRSKASITINIKSIKSVEGSIPEHQFGT